MNRFLKSQKALEVEQQLVSTRTGVQWHFCVKYLANALAQIVGGSRNPAKIDYKEVLDQ